MVPVERAAYAGTRSTGDPERQPTQMPRRRPTSRMRRSAAVGGDRRRHAVGGGQLEHPARGVEDARRPLLRALEREAGELVGDLDQATGVHAVVRRVQDPALLERLLHAGVRQLVVGRAAHDPGRQHVDDLVGDRAAQRARRVHVERRRDQRPVDSTDATCGNSSRTRSTDGGFTSVTTTAAPSSTRCRTRCRPTLPTPATPTVRPARVGAPRPPRPPPACPGTRRTPSAPSCRPPRRGRRSGR